MAYLQQASWMPSRSPARQQLGITPQLGIAPQIGIAPQLGIRGGLGIRGLTKSATPITATTGTPPAAPLTGVAAASVTFGVGAVVLGAFWLFWAMIKRKPKTLASGVLAAGALVLFLATRNQGTRAALGVWLANQRTQGGAQAIMGRVVGWVLRPFGVTEAPPAPAASTAETPPPAAPPLDQTQPDQTQPPQTQPQPIAIEPAAALDGASTGPIVIETQTTQPLEKRFPLRWPDGVPTRELQTIAERMRARIYAGAGDNLQGAFSSSPGTLGPWWVDASRRFSATPQGAAIELARRWYAADPVRAGASLEPVAGVAQVEFGGGVYPVKLTAPTTTTTSPGKMSTLSPTTPAPTPIPIGYK